MSLINPTSKKIFLTFCLMGLATELWAVRAKIRSASLSGELFSKEEERPIVNPLDES